MRAIWSDVAVLVVSLLLAPPVIGGVDRATQDKIVADLLSRHFVAKVDLYQAKVLEGGRVDSEKDNEAIRAGLPIIIDRVTFSSRAIRIKMKHPNVNEITHVDFVFEQALSPDFSREKEIFEKMLASVFDEKTGAK